MLIRTGAIAALTLGMVPVWSMGSTLLDSVVPSNTDSYAINSALPQLAASGFINIATGGGSYIAGSGTLVAPNWVLTAGHVA